MSPEDLDRIADLVVSVCRDMKLPFDSPERIAVAQRLVEAFTDGGEAALAKAVRAAKKRSAARDESGRLDAT